jgi:zinc protease
MLRLFGLLLLLASCAGSQVPNVAFEHYSLPNGMGVILHVDHKTPVVYVNFRFRVGGKYEKPGQNGLAHLFEHLLFQGKDASSGYTMLAERMGATGINGETSDDRTEYYETVPAGRLERILWLESNRFAQFLETVTQSHLDNQRSVVMNERRQGGENEAYGQVTPLMRENVFPPGHPYHHDSSGYFADLQGISLDRVRDFYSTWYTSDRLTLAIAGDFDPAQARQWIAKYFGSMQPGKGVADPPGWAPALDATRTIEVDDRVRTERVYLGWPGPPMVSREQAALVVAARLLGADSSPLAKALNEKLSLGVSVFTDESQDTSLFQIIVSMAPGATVEQVETTVANELARFVRDGPPPDEMQRVKSRLELDQVGEWETLSDLTVALQSTHQFYGSVDRWGDYAGRYSSVSPEEVKAAVGRWLASRHYVAVHVRPMTGNRSDTPAPDRTQPPPLQPEKPYRAPEIQSAQLPNGLRVFVVERHDVPKVAVEVRFRAGMIQLPPAKQAVALLAALLCDKGTASRKGEDLDREMANLALVPHGSADLSSTAVGFEGLRKSFEPGFRLLADVVRNASYPEIAVTIQVKDWLETIDHQEAGQNDFTQPALEAAFGPGHPFAARSMKAAADLRAITAQDVRDYRSRYWKPDVAAVTFAGDITLREAVALTTDALGTWSGKSDPPPIIPPAQPKPGRIFLVDQKSSTQTTVAQFLPGLARDSADYPAMLMVDRVFGGISESRMSQNLRQQKGITYMTGSLLLDYPQTGLWVSFSPVQADQTGVAIQELQKELRAIAGDRPVTARELDEAKTLIIRGLPDSFQYVWSAADAVSQLWAKGLPVTEFQLLSDRVAAMTLAEVNAAARKYIHADKAFFVLIGDRDVVEPQLRGLGLGAAALVQ